MDDVNFPSQEFDALSNINLLDEPNAEAQPTLDSILAELSPLPEETLLLGIAGDGWPLLLNLYDPVPGAVLITGDEGSGKTRLLQLIANAAEALHAPVVVQYGIITENTDEWHHPEESQHNIGIYKTGDQSASDLLSSLVEWAHTNKGNDQCFLLFIDNLEALTKLDEQTKQNLRWLLMRGANRRVWVFTTLNVSRAQEIGAWMDFFRTRVFSRIESHAHAEFVAGNTEKKFNSFTKKVEFTTQEGDQWLDFWIPAV